MNFLAHLYLSGNNPELMVGNFIGDFIKGKQALLQLSPGIANGVHLHRAIDAFTDTHAVVTDSKNRLRPKYRHYSGVIVDVFYDHFLARNWNAYHDDLLPDFAERAYRTIEMFDSILPRDAKYMFPYMTKGNWLVNYGNLSGIHSALSGMSRRTPYESKMNEAIEDLKEYYNEFKSEFERFFPELRLHCEEKIRLLTL